MIVVFYIKTELGDSSCISVSIFFSVIPDIFSSFSESLGRVDVGVIVCGPPGLQSSVAKEIRSQNIRGSWNQAIFHFNSHSFDL